MEPTPCRWERGVAVPDSFAPSSDLATVRGTFTQWYPIATSPPQVGEQLWAKGLDWRDKKRAYQPRIFTGKVLRVTAGNIILDAEVAQGTSGSGLLNVKGEVVGVVVWGKEMEDGKSVTVAIGVWGFVPEGLTKTE
jgi:S1-C subfamily serine protease